MFDQIADKDTACWNALLTAYASNGETNRAKEIFDQMGDRDRISWTALLTAFAKNGQIQEAWKLFDMLIQGFDPDGITFVTILTASGGCAVDCSKSFVAMAVDFSVEPGIKHYSCLIDALCRSGQEEAAQQVLRLMPIVPDAVTWTSLLTACGIHGSPGRTLIAKNATRGKGASPYVLLSNILASSF
ncbi:hypothetical protein SELMODRAFT_106617 [Selaginella moellendorffii]|uniref:Pentacotripeptide-repeat region of PRORP domain-containing protein n=1 Tax=Selaginella moellendorffii TaxID=88036 RepID=D8S1F7_SELML|nr:hypothetical protein SELMODRAFT_106617 [Selaginella moellendorffii]